MLLLKISVFLLEILSLCDCDLFTAIVDLERILHAEKNVANELKLYIQKEEEKLAELKRIPADYDHREDERLARLKLIADDYEAHSIEALANPERHLANPVNAFLLVKRFTADWEDVQKVLNESNTLEDEFLRAIQSNAKNFPGEEDLEGAGTALLRLQRTYALPTEKIAIGDLQGVQQSPELSAAECIYLGYLSFNEGDYELCTSWLEQTLSLVEEDSEVSDTHKAHLLLKLSASVYMEGKLERAIYLIEECLLLDSSVPSALETLTRYKKELEKKNFLSLVGMEKNIEKKDEILSENEAYKKLCRGERIMPIKNEHLLSCQFKRHHPMFYINPLKEEIVNFEPFLVMYHDAISEKEMNKIKKIATPKLRRASIYTYSNRQVTDSTRISKSTFIGDHEDEKIKRISERTAAFCNLTTAHVENLQVVNYGIGGMYEPHYDFAKVDTLVEKAFPGKGNRLLTAIYYLSDVYAGGATVFPNIGVRVPAVKGSCAVWYNLLANGKGDERTLHAGCPVLTGTKWVSNKWFHERGQEFTRKCELDPNL